MIMNRTAQDLAWNCLPLEVRNEVKRQYQIATDAKEYFTECTLEYLFGLHNLTSDAEGEEILTVKRSEIIERYHALTHPFDEYDSSHRRANIFLLQQLFGSKCLPDDTKDDTKDDTIEQNVASNVASLESKPAEPKFKVGDKVKIYKIGNVYNGTIGEIIDITNYGTCYVLFPHNQAWFRFCDLEPYTEPATTFTDDCQSQRQSQAVTDCNHFVKDSDMVKDGDGFCDHNRLHIAAMAMQGILANESSINKILKVVSEKLKEVGSEKLKVDSMTYYIVAKASFLFADALIAEAEKGKKNE